MATAAVTEIGYQLLEYLWQYAKDQLVKHGTEWAASGFAHLLSYLMESDSEKESRMGVKNYQQVLEDFRKGSKKRIGATPYYQPKQSFNEYREGKNSGLKAISRWCILPSTGDKDLDNLMELYWTMTTPQPPGYYGTFWNYMDDNQVTANPDYQITDHTGKALPMKGPFKIKQNLQNQDEHSLQALMDAAEAFFTKNVGLFVGAKSTEGVNARSQAGFLEKQAPQYMEYVTSIFENQLNTLKNVVLSEYQTDNLIQRYHSLIDLYSTEFFSSSHDELDPYEMFDGFGLAIQRTLEHGTFDQAWDVSLQPWFSPATFANFTNALTPEQALFVNWYNNYPPDEKTGLNGLDGMNTEQIFKKYRKAFPDRVDHLPGIDLTDMDGVEAHQPGEEVPPPPTKPDPNDRFYNAAQGNFESYKYQQMQWNEKLRRIRADYQKSHSDYDKQRIINHSRELAGENKELEDQLVNTDKVFDIEHKGNGNWVEDLI